MHPSKLNIGAEPTYPKPSTRQAAKKNRPRTDWSIADSKNLLYSELFKILTCRSTMGATLFIVVLTAVISCGSAWAASLLMMGSNEVGNDLQTHDFQTAGVSVGQVAAVVLGVQAYCTDCTGPHATASFCIISRRAVFVLHKAITVGALAFCSGLLATIISAFSMALVSPDISSIQDGLSYPVFGAALYFAMVSIIAMSVSALFQGNILSMAVIFGFSLFAAPIFSRWPETAILVPYFPDVAGSQMLIAREGVALSPVLGGTVMAAWALALLVAGIVRQRFTNIS